MANAALSREELIAIVERTQKTLSRERLPSSSYAAGLPRAALTELTGTAKVEWLIGFFNENPTLKILWLEENFTLLPTSLLQLGVSPNRIVYVEAKKELVKHLRKALKCQVFDCLVAPSIFEEERVLKALQLLSERANAATILLAKEHRKAWPISVQLEIDRKTFNKKTEFRINIIKEKASRYSLIRFGGP
jgi:hypothetical protein